jgi:hypothetical protein
MPSLAIRPATPPNAHAVIPMHARAPKRSGAIPPDLYAALQLLFAIAQKEMQLPRVPTVEEFLLASCAIEPNSDIDSILQSILGRRYSYTFLTNTGIVVSALLLYNVFPYNLHGIPVDEEDILRRISVGYRWYINFAFSSAGIKAATLLPQLKDWLVQSAIPYIVRQSPPSHRELHQSMLGALDILKKIVATKDYNREIIKPIMHAIIAVGRIQEVA